MHYTTLLQLVLVASTEGLSMGLDNILNTGGRTSDRIQTESPLEELPVGGSILERNNIPRQLSTLLLGKNTTSPDYPYLFTSPLPIPEIARPIFTEIVNGVPIDYYEMTIESFDVQRFPDRGPTTLIGYNGTTPGPTFMIQEGRETIIRVLNNGNRTAAMHLHGMSTHAVWDGWAADELEVGQWKDYYYPNNEGARSIWYHDHAEHHTAVDNYEGQSGVYIIHDPKEDALGLPSGKYDIPLALSDKTYEENGQLKSIEGETVNFVGEFIQVNEQPWPYLNVEPRKYRFRIYDMSASRPYELAVVDEGGDSLDFQVIASDSGLFGQPVTTNDLAMAMGERYEIVVDFAGFSGQNITLANTLHNPAVKDFANADKVMLFVVGNDVSDNSNNGPVPNTLNPALALPMRDNETAVDYVFNFQKGGETTWTINGQDFSDPNSRVLARPAQGSIELWELRHTGGPSDGVHPVHLHLVNMRVLSRTGGHFDRGVLPYETAGLKDTVFLQPGEIVHVLAYYGPWNGLYMFHCHNLIHEDNEMMGAFNVTLLTELGYMYESTQGYDNPEDSQFAAVDFSESAYEEQAKHSVVRSLGSLNAYQPASSVIAAQASYYASTANEQSAVTTPTTPTSAAALSNAGQGSSPSVTSSTRRRLGSNLLGLLGLPNLLGRDLATTTTASWQTLARPTASPAMTAAPSRN